MRGVTWQCDEINSLLTTFWSNDLFVITFTGCKVVFFCGFVGAKKVQSCVLNDDSLESVVSSVRPTSACSGARSSFVEQEAVLLSFFEWNK